MRSIYLDNNATTPVDPRVVEAMLPYFTEFFGNAGSAHAFGRTADEAVTRARESVATSIGAASPHEIIFTSGATESDNLAIKGIAEAWAVDAAPGATAHIVTVATEHPAVLDACDHLLRSHDGVRVTYVGVGEDGLVDLEELAGFITPDTILVSVMAANNEIGVLQDIAAIAGICRQHGVTFHTDATQAIGKIPFSVEELGVDLASFTAHKVYGPKGTGGLYVRSGARVAAQIDGGGQERGIRSGTLNVPGVVGLAKALKLCAEEMPVEPRRQQALRERLLSGLRRELDGVHINGHPEWRLPGHLNLSFEGILADELLAAIPEIALSTGAACHSGSRTASTVLKALGLSDERCFSAVRFGIGRFNSEAEIDLAVERIAQAVRRLRK